MKRRNFLKITGLVSLSTLCSMSSLKELDKYAEELSNTARMPVLFLGHGSPMNAIEENQFVKGFREVAKTIPTPRAILCVSAHWYTKGTKVTAMDMPRTIHDFYGFPQQLYDVNYAAKGDPILAKDTQKILAPTAVELDHDWGLDHGAWSVIKHLYPKAQIPVLQLSIDYTKEPSYHFELAKRLQTLRNKGILIIGSGNIVHNLRLIDFKGINKDNYGFDWAFEAQKTVNDYLLDGNYKPLFQYEKEGKALQLAIPTPDHFLPLIYTLGLQQTKEEISLFNDKLVAGSISMTSVKIG